MDFAVTALLFNNRRTSHCQYYSQFIYSDSDLGLLENATVSDIFDYAYTGI
jgi:hypothetical protein